MAVNRMFKYLQASNQDIVANFAKFDDDGSGELDVTFASNLPCCRQ